MDQKYKLPEQSKLPIEWLMRGQYQPRQYFNQARLEELAETIKQQGLIQPIVVRPITEKLYEILAGERRWRAAQLVGLEEIPVLIRHDVDDERAIEIAIIENIQREDLNPIEEAEVYERLNREFGYTHEEIGQKIGRDRVTVTNKLRLLKLESRVKQLLSDGKLLEGFGIQLAALPIDRQYHIATTGVKNNWSIRRLQKEVRILKEGLLSEGMSDYLVSKNSTANHKVDPNIERLQNKLSAYFGTPILIKHNKKDNSGKVIIDYATLEIFNGLLIRWGIKLDE